MAGKKFTIKYGDRDIVYEDIMRRKHSGQTYGVLVMVVVC